jgi:hypothetical protein
MRLIIFAMLLCALLVAGCGPERRTTFSVFTWTTEDK